MESQQRSNNVQNGHQNSKAINTFILVLNCILLSVGQVGGPLVLRIYYLHGGNRKWLNTWVLTAGFPILIPPISIFYARARSTAPTSSRRLLVTPWLFGASALVGFILCLDGYLFTFGLSYLPISVYSLLDSTQLAFTAVFAFFVVKHKFTHYSINSVVLITFGSVILGLHMDGDRPRGESNGKYVLGFFMTIAAAALRGFTMPAIEYIHLNAGIEITFDVAMQVQFLMSMFATFFCTIPMIINKDFQAISKEAEEFGLGPRKYYIVLVMAAIIMLFLIVGSIGIIFSSTSLLAGILSSLLLAVQQVFAVIFLHERLNAEKGMALAICLWGFASYLYGEYKVSHKKLAAERESEHEAV